VDVFFYWVQLGIAYQAGTTVEFPSTEVQELVYVFNRWHELSLLAYNAVLTGAGHETPGNCAPSHRVRLKT
jgi:hypothetical protein